MLWARIVICAAPPYIACTSAIRRARTSALTLLSRRQCFGGRQKGRGFRPPRFFGQGDALHFEYGDTARKGFGEIFHHCELLRTGQPDQSGLLTLVNQQFDIGEQLRYVLHFVQQYWQAQPFQKAAWIPGRRPALVNIVKGNVGAL